MQQEAQQEKTVLEWLKICRDEGYDWADKAIEYCMQQGCENKIVQTRSEAILYGFKWSYTDMGDDRWNAIHNNLIEKWL